MIIGCDIKVKNLAVGLSESMTVKLEERNVQSRRNHVLKRATGYKAQRIAFKSLDLDRILGGYTRKQVAFPFWA